MTDTTRKNALLALDAAATPGVWAVGIDESAAQVTGFPVIATDSYTIVGTEGMYGDIELDFANAKFIVALVNAYRAGVLAISEADRAGEAG